jgi:hypothetical protein
MQQVHKTVYKGWYLEPEVLQHAQLLRLAPVSRSLLSKLQDAEATATAVRCRCGR